MTLSRSMMRSLRIEPPVVASSRYTRGVRLRPGATKGRCIRKLLDVFLLRIQSCELFLNHNPDKLKKERIIIICIMTTPAVFWKFDDELIILNSFNCK